MPQSASRQFAVLSLLLAATLLAAAEPQLPVVRRMESRYRSATTLQSTFLERYFENGLLLRAESGVAYFRKPGKMRWEYQQPEPNLFLVDGKNAWFYTPVDRTATKIPARQSDDWRTPLALLAGEAKLSRICRKVQLSNMPKLPELLNSPVATTVECALKEDLPADADPLPRVFIEILPTGDLSRIVIQSSGSVLTEFRFKDWQINPPLPDAMFRFLPPPGVAIVEGLLPSSRSVRQK